MSKKNLKLYEKIKKAIKKSNNPRRRSHLCCPSYPNCDIDPLGCCYKTRLEDMEFYGHQG